MADREQPISVLDLAPQDEDVEEEIPLEVAFQVRECDPVPGAAHLG